MYKKEILSVIFFILFLQFLYPDISYGQAISGSGVDSRTTIPIGHYSSLRLKSSSDIVFITGDEKNIVIEADEKFMPYIECVVINDCLTVRNKKEAWFNLIKPIKVYVPVSSGKLTSIINNGSGDIYSDPSLILENDQLAIASNGSGKITLSLKCKDLDLRNSGSSTMRLKGTADHIAVRTGGSGQLDASGLAANDIDIKMGGSSTAKLNCISSLHTDLHVSSTVSVIGHPQITNEKKERGRINVVKE